MRPRQSNAIAHRVSRDVLLGAVEAFHSRWVVRALLVGAVVGALGLRIWILASRLGALDSDEAITGLMARHALDGEFKVMYWLSYYGGSQESLLTAAVFALTGSSVLALKLVSLALFTLGGFLVWRIGIRTIGEPAARIGAVLYWVFPAYFVWWSTKARGYYGLGVVCELVVLLFALRLRERESWRDGAVLGFAVGFGVWTTPQTLLVGLPALGWLAARRPRVLRLLPAALPAGVVGAAPWLWWNAENGWVGVLPKAAAGEGASYFDRLWNLFSATLPTWLGLRVPFSLDWLVGRGVGIALLVTALASGAWLLLKRRGPLEPLLAVALAFPFLYAASSYTYYVPEPRYVLFLGPVIALLAARAAARSLAATGATLLLALGLTVAGVVRMHEQGRFAPRAPDVRVPADLSPLLATLRREGATRVLANYWIAYRISFESRERIIATSTGFVRYQRHDRLVRASPHPAHVFVAGSAAERSQRERLQALGYARLSSGGFVAYVYGRR